MVHFGTMKLNLPVCPDAVSFMVKVKKIIIFRSDHIIVLTETDRVPSGKYNLISEFAHTMNENQVKSYKKYSSWQHCPLTVLAIMAIVL